MMRWLDRPIVWLSIVPVILGGFHIAQAAPEGQIRTSSPVAAPIFVEPPPGDADVAAASDISQVAEEPDVPSLPPLSCDNAYQATSGDSWWRIAERADVDPYRLMELNRADTDTTILIGDRICLPPNTAVSLPSSTTTTTTPAPTSTAPPPTTSSVGPVATTTTKARRITPPDPPPPVSGIDGDCDSWRPLIEAEGIPWSWAKGIIWREARCIGDAHNGNRSTGDHSHGLFQVNLLGSLGPWYAASGYTHDVVSTPAGAIKAAGALYAACGSGPWEPPYSCSGSGELRRYQP